MFFDFIEIGTSDFDTEIQKADNNTKGLSIEPIQYYLDKLPSPNNCYKINVAVSNETGHCDIYYVPAQDIVKYKMPNWIKGCNSIDKPHSTVQLVLSKLNLDQGLIKTKRVEKYKLIDVMKKYNVTGMYYLKVDTEGHDTTILKCFFNECVDNLLLPHKLLFESNILTDKKEVEELINMLVERGYDLQYSATDTSMTLNLNKLKNKKTFHKVDKYYITAYPKGYDTRTLPHDNTLDDAIKYCQKINAAGVTYQKGKYEVRQGPNLMPFPEDEKLCSWVYL